MAYRTTPDSATNCTPAELLFGRKLRTALDIIKPSLSNNIEKNCNNMICRGQNRTNRTKPTEPTQDIDNSNSPSEEVCETPLRQSSRFRSRP